jgi:glycosyltransferase involved in cell wall biosynthesis
MIAPCPLELSEIKGGVESVTVNLLSGFKDNPNVHLVVASVNKNIQEQRIVNYSDNIRIQYIPYGPIKSAKLAMLFHGRKKIRNIVKDFNPDIVHVQGNGTILLSTLGLKKNNIIITQHGILKNELKQQATIKGKLSYSINIITEIICTRKINNWIYISEYNKRLLKRNVKNKLIYNPVNKDFFNVPDTEKNNNKLVYIGGIMKRKGLLDLINVLKDLNQKGINYFLDVIGGVVDQNYKDDIDKIVNENQLHNKIKFHGWKSQKDIIRILKDINILVLPSYQETLPVTIAEAMAAGKIVIATNVGGISEMIEDGKSGFLFEKGNAKQLEKILSTIKNIPALRKKISDNARNRARKMFSAVSVAKQTSEFYKEVINEK